MDKEIALFETCLVFGDMYTKEENAQKTRVRKAVRIKQTKTNKPAKALEKHLKLHTHKTI